jgi:hypothetical protein
VRPYLDELYANKTLSRDAYKDACRMAVRTLASKPQPWDDAVVRATALAQVEGDGDTHGSR